MVAMEIPRTAEPELATVEAELVSQRFDPSGSMEASLAAMVRHQVHLLKSYESEILARCDAKDVHQMHVLSWRLRELIMIQGFPVGKKERSRLNGDLERLGRVLGKVRDLDILIEKTESYAASRSRIDLSDFIGALRADQEELREKVRKHLRGSDYSRLRQSLEQITATAKAGRVPDPESGDATVRPSSVATILPAVLLKRYGRTRAYDEHLDGPLPLRIERFHLLRIEAKRLRYLLEFFKDYLAPDCLALIKRLRRLHDLLGQVQDAQTACSLISRYLETGTVSGKAMSGKYNNLALQSSVLKYLAYRQSELRTCIHRFPLVWRTVLGGWFAGRLAYLVGRL